MKTKEEYNQYHKEYNKKVYYKRMQLARSILGKKCKICEREENLHIDHIKSNSKSYDIDYITRLSLKKFMIELNKCQLLCASCHSKKTQIEVGNTVDHGKGISGKKNCKCYLCLNKKKEYMHKYHLDRKLRIR